MANEFWVEQADRSPQGGEADEDIYFGELVSDDGDGITVLTFADPEHSVGLARGDYQAAQAEDDDDVVEEKYVASDEFRNYVQYHVLEDAARVKVRTPTDEGGSAPAIGHKDVVGYIDETVGDAPAGVTGRIVEEGYSNGATTFNRTNGNFKALGTAYRPAKQDGENVTDFDAPVRVELFGAVEA